jgi:putative tricarboxylic transport membrane protein
MARISKILGSMTGALALGLVTTTGAAVAQEWQPTKPIDFVIMAGAGGGADQIARFIQSVAEQKDLTNRPLVPNNKGGGSGAEALILLNSAPDPNHTLLVTLNSFFTTPLRQENLGVDVTTFTPIALMGADPFVLWVHKDSGITSFEQWVEEVKSMDGEYVMGGTGTGQEDSLVVSYLENNLDLNIKYIPYSGGGEVAKELAGQQIMATVNNPAEAKGFYEAGDVVPLVAFSDGRLPAFPDVPTIQELGHDFTYYNQRAVVGPPDMSEEAAEYYRDLFTQIYESEEWQGYMESESLAERWMSPEEQKAYRQDRIDRHKELLATMEEPA